MTRPEPCRSRIFPSWANRWIDCTSTINPATDRCHTYGHPRKPTEEPWPTKTYPAPPAANPSKTTASKTSSNATDSPDQTTTFQWETRYRELAHEVRALLRALHAELTNPHANITHSIITRQHLDRLHHLTHPQP